MHPEEPVLIDAKDPSLPAAHCSNKFSIGDVTPDVTDLASEQGQMLALTQLAQTDHFIQLMALAQ